AVYPQSSADDLSRGVVAEPADEARTCAECAGPSSHVCGLAACDRARLGHPVVAGHEGIVQAHDHVEEQITEGGQPHASTIVAWTASDAGASLGRSRSVW